MKVDEMVDLMESSGLQASNIYKASEIILNMKKSNAKIILTFTSNMTTSGLRGLFAQLIENRIPNAVVTTVGSIEEDFMRSIGEDFILGDFKVDDHALHEQGSNRVGNIYIKNSSYEKFEGAIRPILEKLYQEKKRWSSVEILKKIGLELDDNNSILYQAAKNDIPIFCPAITDGAFGFHLFMFQQDHDDFIVDTVKDFSEILNFTNQDEKKGVIALGGGVSKHYAIFSCLLNGGMDYAVYMTTAHSTSGSMSGASTDEAKSWGKIKYDSDACTVIGDVSISFPLVMVRVLENLFPK